MKKIHLIGLISGFLLAFHVAADDAMARIHAWERDVSKFQADRANFTNSYAKWAHIAGNETKSREEFLAEAGIEGPNPTAALKSALMIAESNPTDDLGFMVIRFVVSNGREERFYDEYFAPALSMLEAHYLKEARMTPYVASLARTGTSGGKAGKAIFSLLDKVISENPKGSEQRVQAAYHYVNEQSRRLNDLTIPDAERSKLREKFTRYATLAADEAGDFTIWGQPAKEKTGRLFNSVTKLSIGNELPNAQAGVVGGGEDQLSNYRGKVILLDFWATWCVPCVANLPKVVKLKEELAGTSFEVIAISVDDSDEAVIEFMEERMALPFVNWRVGMNSELYRDWNINGVPTYFLIDEHGVIQARGGFAGIPERAKELVKEMKAL